MKVNVEGGELVLRNQNGDTIIVPRNRRKEAMSALLKDDHRAIDALALQLPKADHYASKGTVLEGKDPLDPYEYQLQYNNSPRFKKMIAEGGYPRDEANKRLENTKSVSFETTDFEYPTAQQVATRASDFRPDADLYYQSHYNKDNHNIVLDQSDTRNLSTSMDDIFSHELGHASSNRFSRKDLNTVMSKLRSDYDPDDPDHDLNPDEIHADLNATRYHLYSKGLNVFNKKLNYNDVKRVLSRPDGNIYSKDIPLSVRRNLDRFKPEDLVKILNSVAHNSSRSNTFHAASGGVIPGPNPSPEGIMGPETVIKASRIQKDPDSLGENILEWIDPTGISSYDDVKRSFEDPNSTFLDKTLNVASALPFIGKLSKFIKPGMKFAEGVKHLGQVEGFVKNLAKIGGSIIKMAPSTSNTVRRIYQPVEDLYLNNKYIQKYDNFTKNIHPLRKRNTKDMNLKDMNTINRLITGGRFGINTLDGINEINKNKQ